ncbi:lipopolysaccharide biosynthesis protein [Maribellus sediminis]|uniref:lipopolysaccharide biosynthesis protein n=1 Tax=Maribellus sediminis TaxID=2696285 RepID=UPI00142F7036|nr:oligosaccharide flippase family protein [Maribellus sediminis]
MGIIIKQSIKGAIWSYLGVAIGFITTAYFYPNYLTPEIIGLFALLLAWSELFSQFSLLGFHGVISRLFPYFRNKENGHNGFLFIAFIVMITGFLLFLVVFWLIRPWLIESNIEKSALFSGYVNILVPLTFFSLIFIFLDFFNKLLYNAVLGVFLKEFIQRVIIIGIVLLYILGLLTPHALILVYAGAVSFKGAFMFFYLLFRKELNLRPQPGFVDRKLRKEMISVALYSILTGIGGSIVFRIDKIIINQVMGIEATGIYTIAFFFGTLVILPSRTLLTISNTLISEAWKRNDLATISDIYRKSCLNQFIIAAFIFGGIWINIDNILIILGPEYAEGKWVIFFIGLGYLIDMATGANGNIIALSEYYRMALWFLLILVVLTMVFMYLFIPAWGISGAAAAIAFVFLLNNFMRFVFLKSKYKMQPFTVKFIVVTFVALAAWATTLLLPQLCLIPDIFIRSAVFTILFALMIYFLKVSEEIDRLVKQAANFIKQK